MIINGDDNDDGDESAGDDADRTSHHSTYPLYNIQYYPEPYEVDTIINISI